MLEQVLFSRTGRAENLSGTEHASTDRLRASRIAVVLPRLLERFGAGLREAGHTNEIVDLYAIGFDPVLGERDNANWMDADAPDDVLASMQLRERLSRGREF
jgi:Flavodoxin-like fold